MKVLLDAYIIADNLNTYIKTIENHPDYGDVLYQKLLTLNNHVEGLFFETDGNGVLKLGSDEFRIDYNHIKKHYIAHKYIR